MACGADSECPAATAPCMVAVCADSGCQLQVATAGTVAKVQAAGDCQELICDGRGAAIPRENLGDVPADDANECTEETCSAEGPEHAPLVAGAKCGAEGLCNGKGRCGVCLPDVVRCEKNAAQTCSGEGEWSPPDACVEATPICAQGRCAGITALALGASHSCVLLDGGALRCTGQSAAGQIPGRAPAVVNVPGAAALAIGARHRCALAADGTVRCWGNNVNGELGDGTSAGNAVPVVAVGVDGATQIAAGDGHTCARLAKGTVTCWGRDDKGQLGGAGAAAPSNPTVHPMTLKALAQPGGAVVIPSLDLASLALGGDTTCGLRRNGSIACWGALAISAAPAIPGKPAPPKTTPKPKPVVSVKGVTAVALGGDHACAVLQDGSATCWGDNEKGQLGDGSAAKKHAPAKVKGLAGVVELALGRDHTCARLGDATVQCWGSDAAGQLGDGATTDRRVPGPVPGLAGVAAIVAAGDRTCARLERGTVLCWGDDADGALGGPRPIPTAVTW
jgi:alpha-tubulin suppressor-like RCC1 family protein